MAEAGANERDMGRSGHLEQCVSFGRVLRLMLSGVPFTFRYSSETGCWSSLSTPRFPLGVSLASGLIVVVPTAIIDATELVFDRSDLAAPDVFAMNLAGLAYMVGGVVVINVVFLAWLRILLPSASDETCRRHPSIAAPRIAYFAAVPQLLMAPNLGLWALSIRHMAVVQIPLWVGALSFPLMVLASIARIGIAFQGTRLATDDSLKRGVLATLGCIDAWWALCFAIIVAVNLG